MLETSDEDILAEVRGGETRAFEVIVRRYNQRLYRTARAIVRDEGEAEDVLQESYLRALAHVHSFRGEARLATWLTKIVVHEACARLRRRRRSRLPTELAAAAVPTPEKDAYDGELRGALEVAIDALPVRLRTVFVLRAVQNLSTAETAQVLGITPASVKVRLHRARSALRLRLTVRLDEAAAEVFPFLGVRCARLLAATMRLALYPNAIENSTGKEADHGPGQRQSHRGSARRASHRARDQARRAPPHHRRAAAPDRRGR